MVHAAGPKMVDLSLNQLQDGFEEFADDLFQISIGPSTARKFKYLLFNLDNLKPEIKARFEKEIFDRWHAASTPPFAEESLADTEESRSEDEAPQSEEEPATSGPPTVGPQPKGPQYKKDWFDIIIDWMAALVA